LSRSIAQKRPQTGLGLLEEAVEVLQHPVDAGVGDDAHQVEARLPGLHPVDDGPPDGVSLDQLVGKKLVQPEELLLHDAAGADVLVADLAVAHDPVRQADVVAGGRDQGARVLGVQPVVAGLLREVDRVERVLLRVGVLAPAVANDEEDGLAGRSAHGTAADVS
jgi:hypothetical protein